MRASIVLGAGYGDEGKGVTTDFLCSKALTPIVIRFSGGQQVGHTVIHNGVKHIHSNFGSGTLRDVPTYYSEHTTFYPVTIARELKILKEKGLDPKLIFHPLAKLTTPFDVFENRRDIPNLAHGTCGLGIGKTMKRNDGPFKLYAIDLLNKEQLGTKIISIRDNYYPKFLLTEEQESEIDEYFEAIKELSWNIQDYDYLKNYNDLIFEGSQGILLDMDFGSFPNVTYSNTTSKNAHEILDKLSVQKREIYYVTRCYSTRHGSGHFIEEKLDLINNEEEINVYNKFQGEFKIASLNYKQLNAAFRYDGLFSKSGSGLVTKNLVVTCLDQLPDFILQTRLLPEDIGTIYESHSPESKGLKKIKIEK